MLLLHFPGSRLLAFASALAAAGFASASLAQEQAGAAEPAQAGADAAEPVQRLFIREYRVTGAKQLPRIEVERAVYRHLGPARTMQDVENACRSLEEAYRARGYQTIAVVVPGDQSPAKVRAGIVELRVLEGTVGRLRVLGARFSSPKAVAGLLPSVAEGQVPNFQDLSTEFQAIALVAGREITPDIRAGKAPGTIDIDLKVKERLPVRAGVELNNRYSADTTKLRLNASFGLQNLWQFGHSFNLSYQTAPERREDSEVLSGYYLLPVGAGGNSNLMLQGAWQNSDVTTLNLTPVVGRGYSAGLRFIQTLPTPPPYHVDAPARATAPQVGEGQPSRFHHSLSVGLDFKRNRQKILLQPAEDDDEVKIEETLTAHYPLAATYSLFWETGRWVTEFNTGATLHVRGLGSDGGAFDSSRDKSDGGYFYYRADLTETLRLPWDFRAVGRLQGQLADRPLLPSEQSSAGGLGTVRGYLEAEATGDNGAFASLELVSPSLLPKAWGEWRFHGFLDWGWVGIHEPATGQSDEERLLSIGGGTRVHLGRWFTGSLDVGLPILDGPRTGNDEVRVTFRTALDY